MADDAQSQLGELEKASKDLKGGFTIAKGAAADLVSSGIQAIAGAAKDAITGIFDDATAAALAEFLAARRSRRAKR